MAKFPDLVTAPLGANRKDKFNGVVTARVLHDGTDGVAFNTLPPVNFGSQFFVFGNSLEHAVTVLALANCFSCSYSFFLLLRNIFRASILWGGVLAQPSWLKATILAQAVLVENPHCFRVR